MRRQGRAPVVSSDREPVSAARDPESVVDQRLRAKGMLEELTAEQSEILVCSKVLGLEFAEIAQRLGKSSEAVRQAGSRTIRRLRDLEHHGVDPITGLDLATARIPR